MTPRPPQVSAAKPRLRLLHVGSLLLSSGLLLLGVTGSSAPSQSPADRVHAAADALEAYDLEHSIASRLQNGLPIEELPDITAAGAARDAAFYWQQLANVDGIQDSQLGEDDAVSLAVLRRIARDEVEASRFSGLTMPVTPYSSPLRTVEQAFSMHPLQNPKDAEHYLTLLHRVAPWIGTFEARLREQASRGVVLAAPEIPLAAGPFATARQEGSKSPFAVSEARLEALPAAGRAAFAKSVGETIRREVNPALESLGKYLTGDYAKSAPPTVGLGQYAGGSEYYRFLVRFHTTLDLAPEQIHRIGLDEMDRISKALEAVRQQVGFAGTLAEFRKFLRTDAQFFPKSADEIGERMMKNQQRILPRIPEFFARTPKAPAGVERLATALEGSMTFGYYDPPNPAHAKGLYYYNGSKLDQRSMLTSAALVAHELVPGHHFQIALQRENTALPAFRQSYFTTAYVEGWGEYASDLAEQMGMYQDPYDHAGRLMMDAHLSGRLVVDTGMNALGWSRERAMQYLSDNTLLSETEVATETLRYACDLPGQALAYKMGMKKMVELRERARAVLGPRFDIRQFHDLVLGGGSMPMNVLEQRVDRWIAAALH
ncbi:MAG: DUF885 domain-containing protein [Acidobacteriota bacterium]